MAADNISVLLKLRGGKEFRRDADAAGRSVKGITGHTKRLGTESARTDRAVSKHRRGLVALGTAAKYGGAALGGGLVLGLKSSIMAYNESRKVTAQTENAIKRSGGAAKVTAKHVEALGTSIMKKTGIDNEAIKTGSNMLLTFKGIRNEVGRGNKVFDMATQASVDMAATFGGDAQRSAVMLGKALNDPLKGMTKLTRVGVSFTAQEEKKIKAMAKSGNLLGAQKLMLKAINSQGIGGAAAAKSTPIDKMKTSIDQLQQAIGGKLAPIVDKVATKLNRFVTGMQAGTGQGGRFVRTMVGLWKGIKPVAIWTGHAAAALGRFGAKHPGLTKVVAAALLASIAIRKIPGGEWLSKKLLSGLGGLAAKLFVRLVGPETAASVAAGRIAGKAGGRKIADATSATLGSGTSMGKFKSVGSSAGKVLGKEMGIAAAAAAAVALGELIRPIITKAGDKLTGTKQQDRNNWVDKNIPGMKGLRGFGNKLGLPGGRMGGHVTPGGIKRFAGGGMVPKGEDTLAGLRYGEFVQRQSAVRREGVGAMRALNEGRARITMPDRVPVDLGGLMANRAGGGSPIHVEVKLGEKVLMEAFATHVDRKHQRR